jgi:hypothetical protein
MRRISQVILVIALLLSSVAISPGVAVQGKSTEGQPVSQTTPDPAGTKVYMPVIRLDPSYTVTGQVTDSLGKPVANVKIVNQDGRSAYTDASGKYTLGGLPAGSNGLAPAKNGMIFSPSLSQVKLPVTNSPQDFKAYQQCPDFVLNGSFEDSTAWQQPVTEYTAGYTTAAAHTGVRAMRTGITDAAQNKYSYSSTRQPIKIPKGTTGAILRMWLYPVSSDTSTLAMPSLPNGLEMDNEALGSDGQYVLVVDPEDDPYDPDTGELLETLLWMRSNDQQWGLYEFNLSEYASPTEDVWIKIQAGTYNDGIGGVTSMYVDDVVLELCDAATAPIAPTPPTVPAGCSNAFLNSNFEQVDSGWSIPVTAFSARYSSKQYISPVQSMRTGIVDVAKNIFSYSDAWQLATIPNDATGATLNLSVYHVSTGYLTSVQAPEEPLPVGIKFSDLALTSDMSYILVLDQYGNIIEWLYREYSNNDQVWTALSFDLSKYADTSEYPYGNIRIQFGTYNNGPAYGDGITAMFVDDATFNICTDSTPTPTPTPGPTPVPQPTPVPGTCNEGFLNTGFETNDGWDIPITVFSAGYSTDAAHTGVRSMRNGIPYYVMDRYSYSDAYQVASIPLTVDTSTIGMWIYPISGELATAAVANQPTAELLTSATSAGDVQYVLVLDRYGNWIDTLLWQRKNSQVWTYHTFDVSKWIGTTIRLQFGVYNNGYSGATSMYVDDTSLQLCP